MLQAFTALFSSSSKAETVPATTPQTNEGDKLVSLEATPPGIIALGPVTEGLNLQSFGRVQRATPDAQLIFNERETRRALKERFFGTEGAISTSSLATLVERLQESKQREEEAVNRIRAKTAPKIEAKETKRRQLLARMEAKKQPHLNAIALIEDKILRAGFKK